MKVGQLVKSKLPEHDKLTTWRILEVVEGVSGRLRYICEAAHDTELSYGFDKIKHDFKTTEIELA